MYVCMVLLADQYVHMCRCENRLQYNFLQISNFQHCKYKLEQILESTKIYWKEKYPIIIFNKCVLHILLSFAHILWYLKYGILTMFSHSKGWSLFPIENCKKCWAYTLWYLTLFVAKSPSKFWFKSTQFWYIIDYFRPILGFRVKM